ncbi:unnamed protein product [Oncorhynchus mykiss]|uniref:c-SKI SMAD4-binding domain-containing protein n=1 Tax=Oncorhynchus mykiss TaxID=8022 RepID=A0A060YHQ5_ONCMY|nr:unnamed protein product [Oncorhynchus mykiss]
MESIPNQQPAGRDSSSSPSSKQDVQPFSSPISLKPNQVSETALYGVHIVSLVIDGQERLCLAQISNTLLKNYSYNEIHNRRVALGITCVQCTPVQLEILRRAGAMPISSRRCGMITKREAERLCKSFLGAHNPPKLPENFAFDVSHECAWGSRGSFIPARYNSSRAKCIKCTYCNMYFSPNKFIFHSHRTPESKYTQPDAANFNSWRRHLKLTDKSSSDDVAHAWEDVKAMFNGGSRKRTLPMSGSSILSNGVRNYPVIPVPSKSFGMLQKIQPPLFPHPYGFPAFGLCQKKDDGVGETNKTNVSGINYISAFRPVVKDAESIAKLYGNRDTYSGVRSGYLSPDFVSESSSYRSMSPDVDSVDDPDVDVESNRAHEDEESVQLSVEDRQSPPPLNSAHSGPEDSRELGTNPHSGSSDDERQGGQVSERHDTPVWTTIQLLPYNYKLETCHLYTHEKDGHMPLNGPSTFGSKHSSPLQSNGVLHVSDPHKQRSPTREDVPQRAYQDQAKESPPCESLSLSLSLCSYILNITNTCERGSICISTSSKPTISTFEKNLVLHSEAKRLLASAIYRVSMLKATFGIYCSVYCLFTTTIMIMVMTASVCRGTSETACRTSGAQKKSYSRFHHLGLFQNEFKHKETYSEHIDYNEANISGQRHGAEMEVNDCFASKARAAPVSPRIDVFILMLKLYYLDLRTVFNSSRLLAHYADNFQDQMKRELSYREEMVQQLHIVRGESLKIPEGEQHTLHDTSPFSLEAHDALHHFSCKMLTPRHCTGACTFKPPLLPP